MNIRPAHPDEIEDVLTLVKAAIRHMESQGIHQWDEVYPDRFVLQADLDKGHMHVIESGDHMAGIVVINEDQSPEYTTVRWQYPGRALVVHRLITSPLHERRGLARQLMAFAEKTATANGYDTVRLDAFTENRGAVALYEHLGYRNAGTVRFRKGIFYCYEKQVSGASAVKGGMRMDQKDPIDLNIDMSRIQDHQQYGELWNRIGKIEIRMVEQHEECTHKLGDAFVYETPYRKPANVCNALLHVLDLYTWRVALGFPSWNSEDRRIHKIHCPDPKGTVWEMRKITE